MSTVEAVPVAIISARHWPIAGASLNEWPLPPTARYMPSTHRRMVDDHAPIGGDGVEARPTSYNLCIGKVRHPVGKARARILDEGRVGPAVVVVRGDRLILFWDARRRLGRYRVSIGGTEVYALDHVGDGALRGKGT